MLHTKFQGHRSIGSGEEESVGDQIRPWHKMDHGSTQGHNLNNLGSTRIDNATYQVSRSSVNWFWRRRFFKVFTIYGHGGHLGHVTRTV